MSRISKRSRFYLECRLLRKLRQAHPDFSTGLPGCIRVPIRWFGLFGLGPYAWGEAVHAEAARKEGAA